MIRPLLVVRILTYNHEKFIKDCLEGVVNQVTNFSFIAVLSDDCSTDNTFTIVEKYKEKYPDLFILIRNDENNITLNSKKNWDKCFELNSKYIALLEGDDYWTDPYKLQKQVDFLESNNEIVLCCHNNHIIDDSNERINEDFFIKDNSILTTENLLGYTYFNIIPTASVVFRNILTKINFQFISLCPFGDFPLYIELSKFGNIYFDKNVYSVYRRNGKGISSSLTKLKQLNHLIEFYILVKVFHSDYTSIAVEKINYIHNLIEEINFNNINYRLDHQKKELAEFYTNESTLLKNNSFWYLSKLILKKMIRFISKKNK